MKVERREDGITLIPQNDFEIECLKVVRSRGVDKIRFMDDWDQKGPLFMDFPKHPWDRE